jgi:hypothetical protein
MRPGTVAALILAIAVGGILIYSAVITPRMDSGVPEEGYRPPIQDLPAGEKQKPPPLVDSNVPPAGGQSR